MAIPTKPNLFNNVPSDSFLHDLPLLKFLRKEYQKVLKKYLSSVILTRKIKDKTK